MTPHIQANTNADPDWLAKGTSPGNCLQTAIAAWLDMPVEDVPHFAADERPGPGWWAAMRTWAREVRGEDFSWATVEDAREVRDEVVERGLWGGLLIASGRTARETQHVVLVRADDLTLAHDPHHSGDGLLSIDDLIWLGSLYEPSPEQQYQDAIATELEKP